jgi:HSP20 family molecular chaperone IbpA
MVRDPGAGMLREMLDMLDRADRLNRQFFHAQAPGGTRRPAWEPPVDVFETPDALFALVALPGVARERIDVRLDDAGLLVAGERPLPAALRDAAVRRLEIPYGRFERRIDLPAGRWLTEPWALVDGCLLLTLRRLA